MVTELELEVALDTEDATELMEDKLRTDDIDNDELELRKLDTDVLEDLDEALEDVAPTIP